MLPPSQRKYCNLLPAHIIACASSVTVRCKVDSQVMWGCTGPQAPLEFMLSVERSILDQVLRRLSRYMPGSQDHGTAYEKEHVHEVYEQIASHFSSTRYKVRFQ